MAAPRMGDQSRLGGDFFGGGSRVKGEAAAVGGFFGAFGFLISRVLRF